MSNRESNNFGREADEIADRLRATPTKHSLDQASVILDALCRNRDFDRLSSLAELISRYRPNDFRVRRLLAQGLTEIGYASVAVDVASAALQLAEASSDNERNELSGVLGRACKQIFIDDTTAASSDSISGGARIAIEKSIAAYRSPWERNKKDNTWHGINLAAMLSVAESRNFPIADQLDKTDIAKEVLDSLAASPVTERDTWWHATKAEAHVARNEWPAAELAIRAYVLDETVPAFNFASTLRQFREVWRVQNQGPDGMGLIQALEARYLQREEAISDKTLGKPALLISPSHLRSVRSAPLPEEAQLERVLGSADTLSIRWYRTGLQRAASVAAIRKRMSTRTGTGFAVRSEDFGLDPGEILVLTNFHVVNIEGAGIGSRPESVEIVFEAEDPQQISPFRIEEVIAQSPSKGGLDFALLRLDRPANDVRGVPLTAELPSASTKERVYVIGHPRGHELQFSLQDNWVVDHEGPPHGTPPRTERVRVHYFTPTDSGSSGSPVFDDAWDCIALHHAGAKHDPPPEDSGMRMLNGQSGYYSANEGICIQSIRDAVVKAIS